MEKNPLEQIRIGATSAQWAKHNQIPSFYEKTVTSTNDLAKAEAFDKDAAEDVKVYFCDHQTKGRGRGANVWNEGQTGTALLSSWSYLLGVAPQPILTPRVGLALLTAAHSVWPFLDWSLKAPNDLYVGDKKIAGLLLETVSQGDEFRLVVGLGFNALAAPDNIPTATSLLVELPHGVPLLGEDWVAFLEHWFFSLTDAVTREPGPLSTTERESLKWALNLRPGLQERYTLIRGDGSLEIGDRVIPWMEI